MIVDVLKIAFLCVVIGSASIPLSFGVNSSPWIVWFGNALGSLISALVVVYISNRIVSDDFRKKISRTRIGTKIVKVLDEGVDSKEGVKARGFINKYGLKAFSLLCPIFPGVLISTATVYLLELDRQVYKRWMFAGVVFVSGAYVFGYWFIFVQR